MARGHSDQKMKAEVIRLRVEERLPIREICSRTGVPKGTASMWLQPYPRTEEEKKRRSPYPRTKKCAPVAQLEEHHVDIVKVAGSGPVRRTING